MSRLPLPKAVNYNKHLQQHAMKAQALCTGISCVCMLQHNVQFLSLSLAAMPPTPLNGSSGHLWLLDEESCSQL